MRRMQFMFTRATILTLCALTLACSGSAPTSPPSTSVPPATTFALTGHVSDVNTLAPLSGATVAILDGKNALRATFSDANGGFRLTGLTAGGFTIRVRYDGYDSVFRGIIFVADTSIDVQMRPARQTLAGTWTGVLSFLLGTAPREVSIPQLTIVHTASSVSSAFLTSGPYQGSFTGTLKDPSAIASTTDVTGTLTLTLDLSGRGPLTCTGTSDFTGTVNWTQMMITTPLIILECGTTATNVAIALVRQQ
jgi:hypothetical protein